MDPSRSVPHDLDLTPELLASQGSALRALARRLLGDAHEAEDVVQDTWLATLRQGASVRGRVSGWLARVVRNRSLQAQRGAARRRGRELDVARPERIDADPDALLARQEALRAVTEALLELDEPYRVVLLLRFYEDRAPIEIARALGLPPTTVKSRLERGLELLRARLAARGHRDRHHAGLLLLAGRPAGTVAGPISLGIGVLAMGTKTLLVTAAAAVACGLLWTLSGTDDDTPPGLEPTVVGAAVPTLQSDRLPPSAQDDEPSAREPIAAEGTDTAEGSGATLVAAGFEQSLSVHVRDGDGLPFSGAEIHVGYRGGRMQSMGVTGETGALALRFPSTAPALELLVEVRGGGESSGIRRVELVSGRESRLDLGLHTRHGNPRLIRVQTQLQGSDLVEIPPTLGYGASLTVSSDWIRAEDRTRRVLFEEPPPGGPCTRERPETEIRVADLLLADGQRLANLGYVNRIVTRLEPPTAELTISAVSFGGSVHARGLVRNGLGEPAPGVTLAVASGDGSFQRRGVTDDEGRFDIEVPADRTARLRAGGGDAGLDELEVTTKAGEDITWDPLLVRGGEVIGQVVDPGGHALGGRRVELVQSGPGTLWTTVTETRDDGRFAVPNLPPGLFDVVVLGRSDGGMVPARTISRVAAGEDLGVIALSEHQLGSGTISIAARDLEGNPAPEGVLRLWHEDSDRVLQTSAGPEDSEPGTLACAGLPSGHYGIEVLCDLGEQQLGSVWLEPGDTLDLGEACFRSLGTLALVAEDGQRVPDLALRRLHQTLEAHVLDLAGPMMVALRPGEYALDGSRRVARARFAVASGEVTALALTEDEEGLRFGPTVPPPFAASAQDCTSCHAR